MEPFLIRVAVPGILAGSDGKKDLRDITGELPERLGCPYRKRDYTAVHTVPFLPAVYKERDGFITGSNIPDCIEELLIADTRVHGQRAEQGNVGVQFKEIQNPEPVRNFLNNFPDTPFCPGEANLDKVRWVHAWKGVLLFPVCAARLN
jgi:hypothetical protein